MIRLATAFATLLSLAAVPAAAQPAKATSIVLVHGAFVDASGWKSVYDLLTKDGYEVLVVQNPTVTLEGDVAATARVIAAAKHPVVLVGHSYGGAVITQAGANPKVRSVVYVAAFAPDIGESVLQLAEQPTPGELHAPLLPPNDGFLLVDQAKFAGAFAGGVDPALTRFMAASQVPWGLGAVSAKISATAWKNKPTYFMVTTQDLMIPPSAQRFMATRANATTVEIASPHAVMLAHPRDVAAFIEKAAAAVK
jgi:pimeloyl-ACP methyl ester carboxylesterase